MKQEEDEDQLVRNLFREITKYFLNAERLRRICFISSMRL